MIITCQNCLTHYSIGAGVLGEGKRVQCHNCGYSWYQNPVQAAPPPPPPPQPAAMAEQPPIAKAPVPEPEPMPEPEPAPEGEAETASEGEAEEAAEPVAEGDALSPEQLDEMFGEDTETDPFQSLADTEPPADDADEEVDLENIPDPEPIPQVFSPEKDDPIDGKGMDKGGKGKIIGIAAVVVVIALGAGAFFGRSFIIDRWPGAADTYSRAGLGGDELGAGLDIRDVKSSREVEAGVDVLVVRGVVANITEEDRMVPIIRVALYDGDGEEVQHVFAPPLKNRLQPGATIGFSVKLPEPSALARRLEVTFSEPKKTSG